MLCSCSSSLGGRLAAVGGSTHLEPRSPHTQLGREPEPRSPATASDAQGRAASNAVDLPSISVAAFEPPGSAQGSTRSGGDASAAAWQESAQPTPSHMGVVAAAHAISIARRRPTQGCRWPGSEGAARPCGCVLGVLCMHIDNMCMCMYLRRCGLSRPGAAAAAAAQTRAGSGARCSTIQRG